MKHLSHQSVKYSGINTATTLYTPYFKAFNKSSIIAFAPSSPPACDILECSVSTQITNAYLFPKDAPTKLSIQGDLCLTIHYTSLDTSHTVHVFQVKTSFSEHIPFSSHTLFAPTPRPCVLVEDLFTYLLDPNYIYYNVTLVGCVNFY